MCICMCVYVCVYMYVCICMCVYIHGGCMYVCMCVHMYMHVSVYACMCTCICAYVYVFVYVYVSMYVVCIYICMYIYVCRYVYACMCVCVCICIYVHLYIYNYVQHEEHICGRALYKSVIIIIIIIMPPYGTSTHCIGATHATLRSPLPNLGRLGVSAGDSLLKNDVICSCIFGPVLACNNWQKHNFCKLFAMLHGLGCIAKMWRASHFCWWCRGCSSCRDSPAHWWHGFHGSRSSCKWVDSTATWWWSCIPSCFIGLLLKTQSSAFEAEFSGEKEPTI